MRRREFIQLAATGIVAGLTGLASATPPPVGKMAPEFSVTLTDGRIVSLRDFRGQPVLVNFWSSG